MSEEKSDLKGLGISFVIIVLVMVGIPYGVTFLFPTQGVWRGPPPKRPRHILKPFCNVGYRRECGLVSLRNVNCKNHIAALALLQCSINIMDCMISSLFIQTNLSPQPSPPRMLGFFLTPALALIRMRPKYRPSCFSLLCWLKTPQYLLPECWDFL